MNYRKLLLAGMGMTMSLSVNAQQDAKEKIPMEKITIYQVLPRTYTNLSTANVKNGTLAENGVGKMNDFTPALLKRIRQNGYSHIWYTGLLEHATKTDYTAAGIRRDHAEVVKGNAGSPYAVKDYFDIDPDLAVDVSQRLAEFEALVDRTHKAGLKLVMDFIPNHVAREYHSDAKPKGASDLGEGDDVSKAFSPQNNFYYFPDEPLHLDSIVEGTATYQEFPAKATGNDRFDAYPQRNDWYETIKLNYGVDYLNGRSRHFDPIPSTWTKMTQILLYWAAKGVDAFRCDMAEMVPVEFWEYAIAEVKKAHPDILFIAEIYNPNEYRNYIHKGGFDYLYNKVGLYDTLRGVMRREVPAHSVTACWQDVNDVRDNMLNFLENHDEQRIASPFFAGDARRGKPAFVVSALMDKAGVMVYGGQEVGESGMDDEGFSGLDGRTTIFDYWGVKGLQDLQRLSLDEAQQSLYDFYQKVVNLADKDKAVREGAFFDLMYVNHDRSRFDSERQYAFLRHVEGETLLVVANFAEEEAEVGVVVPRHAFDFLRLKPSHRKAKDLLTGEQQKIDFKADVPIPLRIPALSALVLKI